MVDISRREVLILGGAACALPGQERKAWHQRVRRVGQVNFSEKDVAEADVKAWADYWASAKVDAVQINVTGMIAFYPTKVPFHRQSRYLNGRDFFGECCRAARARGIRVIGRLSPDLQWEEALAAHPEWFVRDRAGEPVPPFSRTPGLFQTCMFSTYYTEQTVAVMREVNSLYDVDAFYANGWPNWNMPVCYCNVCRALPTPGTQEYRERFMQRVIELWDLFDRIQGAGRGQDLLRKPGRWIPDGAGSAAARQALRVVQRRQPGENKPLAGVGGIAARPCRAVRDEGEDDHQRHGRVVDREPDVAERGEEPRRSGDVDGADGSQRHGDLVSLAGRADGAWGGPAMAGNRAAVS
ncbi:MAG: hypothetical protein HXY18_15835 [Bryobacteraceae bacterium]|nr:hypothetical protein [Bryobacteraceae bacterium]